MDPHSSHKLFATKYCFLMPGDDTSFFFFLSFSVFCYFTLPLVFTKIILLLLLLLLLLLFIYLFIYFFFFMKIILFFHVPECSGMFRNVPCSRFYRRPTTRLFGQLMVPILNFDLQVLPSRGPMIFTVFVST